MTVTSAPQYFLCSSGLGLPLCFLATDMLSHLSVVITQFSSMDKLMKLIHSCGMYS
jgi:hypothetical protein